MVDYIKCLLLFLVAIIFFIGIGSSINKDNEQNGSYKFVLGYVIYTFLAAVPGIIVQVLALPWMAYCIYLVVLWFFFVVLILRKKINLKRKKIDILNYIKNNYFLFIITFILLCISFLYVWLFWANNHSDDGFFIGKIAEYPYMENPFRTNVVNGFSEINAIDSYVINTWELQSSVVAYVFGINPVLYVRLFLNAFNIFLLINVVKGLTIQINEKARVLDSNKLSKSAQYVAILILFLSFNSSFLEQTGLLQLTDLWQFNSGMYLGSSMVRVIGLPILLMFFIGIEKLSLKNVLMAIIMSVVLMSKSTIALPILVLFCIMFFFLYFLQQKGKRLIAILLIILCILISVLLPNNSDVEDMLFTFLNNNLHSWVIIISIIIYLSSFFTKNKYIVTLNIFILGMFILMFVRPLNNIFETSSVFTFVAGRTHTSFVYTFLIINFMYVVMFLTYYLRKSMSISIFLTSAIIMSYCSFYTFKVTGNFRDSYRLVYTNKNLIPKSTEMLSKELNNLSKTKDLTVICPTLPLVNGRSHTLSVCLRFWAPDIKNVSSLIRFANSNASEYLTYDSEIQEQFNEFSINPNNETSIVLFKMIEDYPINTIVVENKGAQIYLSQFGFTLTSSIVDEINNKSYYIFIN